MNCIVPFNKDIKFKTNIGEIKSVSLEHEITINDQALLGNFLVTGEYKVHEVSVNTDEFSYTIPFDVAFPNSIIKDTVSFDIENFTYEIIKPDILRIDIEFRVIGDEEIPEKVLSFDEILEDTKKESDRNDEIDVKDLKEKTINEEVEKEITDNEAKSEQDDRLDKESENSILSIGSSSAETFITYHVHIVKEGENIESICKIYNVTSNALAEYNDLNALDIGSKLIIPLDE